VLVSHDRRTLPDHFRDFIASQTSPGVIIVSQKLSIGGTAALAVGHDRSRRVYKYNLRPPLSTV
jgi:hypothetical protein